MTKHPVEYIWLGGNNEFRSKIRVLEVYPGSQLSLNTVPEWNYDGSSTAQADGDSSEIVLRPCALFGDRFVLCETFTPDGNPLPNNHRPSAKQIFERYSDEKPWYGIEQEYFIIDPKTKLPLGYSDILKDGRSQGDFYCSVGASKALGRYIAVKHMDECIKNDINISGINAEVAPAQWEFQVGPCEGIASGDHLLMARFLLERVAEECGYDICWDPKPLKGEWNGSGCHTNFSTKAMREGHLNRRGFDYIREAVEKLEERHEEHMKVYGEGNRERMSGNYETAKYDEFSWGIGNRGASVRIGNDTYRNGRGYFEDRRPASNMNPYQVTSMLLDTTMWNN